MYIDDYITPAELTWYAREVPSPANLLLERFLPARQINHIEAELGEITRTNRAARFRSWDTPVGIGRRDYAETRRIKIPPLGQKLPVGEYEMLQLSLARTGGNDRAAMIEEIYRDTDNNVRSIYNRLEIARGDVLTDGKFTLADEDGLTLEADFGLPSGNNVTPAVLWDDATNAVPLTNMRSWMMSYATLNGVRPGFMVCGEAVISALEMNEEVRQAISYGGNILKPFATDAELAGIFSTNRFPTIVPYDTVIEWTPGVNRRVLPENKVIFLPPTPTDLGFTAFGITAEALALMGSNNPQLTFQQAPGLVAVTTREGDPPRVWSKAGATAMPLITDVRKLMVATVLPA